MSASVAAFTPSRYSSTLFEAPPVALPEGVLSSLLSLLNPDFLWEKCQKTLIKRKNPAVDPSSDDPYEKTLIKRYNSLECLLNYAC
jgi:hypothetical protein